VNFVVFIVIGFGTFVIAIMIIVVAVICPVALFLPIGYNMVLGLVGVIVAFVFNNLSS
jgi:hypothetical protein